MVDDDIYLYFRILVEHKSFLSTWRKTFLHTREKEVFFLKHSQDFSCTNSPRKTIASDVCGGLSSTRSKKKWIHVSVRVKILRKSRLLPKNHADYNFFHQLMITLCLCLALMIFSFCRVNFFCPCEHGDNYHIRSWFRTDCHQKKMDSVKITTMKPSHALDHTIDLEFDDTEARRNARIDPSTVKMMQWYQKHNRVSDLKAPTGTDRSSDYARELIEDDDERLAMRNRWHASTSTWTTELRTDSPCHLRKRPTLKHGLDYCRSVFPNPWGKQAQSP